jgi:hypothetical protein
MELAWNCEVTVTPALREVGARFGTSRSVLDWRQRDYESFRLIHFSADKREHRVE